MEEILSDTNTYAFVNKDPSKKLTRDLHTFLVRWKRDQFIDELTYRRLLTSDGVIPRAYGLIKIHKEDYSLRVIVSCINSPLYNFSLFLHNLISDVISIPKSSHLDYNKGIDIFEAVHQSLQKFDIYFSKTLIKSGQKFLSHQEFQNFLKDHNAIYTDVLVVSAEKCLEKLFAMRKEIFLFTREYNKCMTLFKNHLENNNLHFFPFKKQFNIIESLISQFNTRFNDFKTLRQDLILFENPLTVQIEEQSLGFQKEPCDLQCDISIKIRQEKGIEFLKILDVLCYPRLRPMDTSTRNVITEQLQGHDFDWYNVTFTISDKEHLQTELNHLKLTLQKNRHDKKDIIKKRANKNNRILNKHNIRTIFKSPKKIQFSWLREYIELNTNFRTLAKNEFEKNLFKLMNNVVFGKVARYGVEAMITKPNFRSRSVFSENLIAIEMRKLEVKFNKTDTDSLIYKGYEKGKRQSNIVARSIMFEDYTWCLNDAIEMMRRQSNIRSKLHEVDTISEKKKSL
ncbi:GT2D2 protein, partial [Acromyrmex charruanus]